MDGGRSGQRGSHAQSDAQLGSVMKVELVRATGSRLLERQVGCSNHPHPPTPSSVPRKSENLEIFLPVIGGLLTFSMSITSIIALLMRVYIARKNRNRDHPSFNN